MPILIDHTALDATALTATDIRAIGEFVATIGKRIGASSIAVVVPDRLTFGFVRMGELIANQPQLNLKTFYSLDKAVAWLPNHGAAGEASGRTDYAIVPWVSGLRSSSLRRTPDCAIQNASGEGSRRRLAPQ
jgi:hypothetical protein